MVYFEVCLVLKQKDEHQIVFLYSLDGFSMPWFKCNIFFLKNYFLRCLKSNEHMSPREIIIS